MKKRYLAAMLCVSLAVSLFAGCTKEEKQVSKGAEVILNGEEIYPVSCEDTLTYLMGLNIFLQNSYENFIETPLGQELEKNTGIKVEYIHPQNGQETEQINILMASNELPDMVSHQWSNYPGGPDRAINEDVIYSLNEYIDEYAPNYKKYLEENEDVAKKVKTDEGNHYIFPFIREETWMGAYKGIVVRNDWLEKTGLSVPKTIDEFDKMLYKFKGISKGEPLNIGKEVLMYAYGIGDEFYLDENGEVQYGPIQPEYKEVITLMNKWYKEGILNPDFAVMDGARRDSDILNDKAGVFYGAVGGAIGKYLGAKPSDNPDFDLIAIPQITKNGDEVPEFAYLEDRVNLNGGAALSKNCKNIELAIRYLDYGYSDQGYMLYNFGIEGISYNMVDGEPVLTDLLINNPDGESIDTIAPRYLRASYSGQFVQDGRYVKQSLIYPQQIAAYDTWGKSNMEKHIMPPVTLLPEELDKSSDIIVNVKTYVDEMFVKFVDGSKPIEDFDKYVEQLKAFGIDDLLKMKRSAVERFNKR